MASSATIAVLRNKYHCWGRALCSVPGGIVQVHPPGNAPPTGLVGLIMNEHLAILA